MGWGGVDVGVGVGGVELPQAGWEQAGHMRGRAELQLHAVRLRHGLKSDVCRSAEQRAAVSVPRQRTPLRKACTNTRQKVAARHMQHSLDGQQVAVSCEQEMGQEHSLKGPVQHGLVQACASVPAFACACGTGAPATAPWAHAARARHPPGGHSSSSGTPSLPWLRQEAVSAGARKPRAGSAVPAPANRLWRLQKVAEGAGRRRFARKDKGATKPTSYGAGQQRQQRCVDFQHVELRHDRMGIEKYWEQTVST